MRISTTYSTGQRADTHTRSRLRDGFLTVSRVLLATVFLSSGESTLRNPSDVAELLEAKKFPAPVALTRLNAALMLGGGLLLASGLRPRLASAMLGSSITSSTLVAHAFWGIANAESRNQNKIQFQKNLAILGGLIHVAARDK